MKPSSTKVTSLPFDLYTRHYLVAKFVNQALRSQKESLKILDLGGYAGKTSLFFEGDSVTVLDMYDSNDKNYVKGDATNLQFADNSFDVVTNFDVYEHIPRKSRKAFISEAVRVAKRAVIMTMPVDDGSGATSQAEVLLNDFYKTVAGKPHPWLKEHIEYGIPTQQELDKILQFMKLEYAFIKSNAIVDWKLIEALNFLGTVDGAAYEQAKKINRFYNTHVDMQEATSDSGYRGIYIIAKKPSDITKIKRVIERHKEDQDKQSNGDNSAQQLALDMVLDRLADVFKVSKQQQGEIGSLAETNHRLNLEIATLQERISLYEKSVSWKITKPVRVAKKIIRK